MCSGVAKGARRKERKKVRLREGEGLATRARVTHPSARRHHGVWMPDAIAPPPPPNKCKFASHNTQ